jgi:hypothetical protein
MRRVPTCVRRGDPSRWLAGGALAFVFGIGVALGPIYLMLLAIFAVPLGALGAAVHRSIRHQQSLPWWIAVAIWLSTIAIWYSGQSLWLAAAVAAALMLGGLLLLRLRSTG